jgi:hypothetical protein
MVMAKFSQARLVTLVHIPEEISFIFSEWGDSD